MTWRISDSTQTFVTDLIDKLMTNFDTAMIQLISPAQIIEVLLN
jgi:hypothetical protein